MDVVCSTQVTSRLACPGRRSGEGVMWDVKCVKDEEELRTEKEMGRRWVWWRRDMRRHGCEKPLSVVVHSLPHIRHQTFDVFRSLHHATIKAAAATLPLPFLPLLSQRSMHTFYLSTRRPCSLLLFVENMVTPLDGDAGGRVALPRLSASPAHLTCKHQTPILPACTSPFSHRSLYTLRPSAASAPACRYSVSIGNISTFPRMNPCQCVPRPWLKLFISAIIFLPT